MCFIFLICYTSTCNLLAFWKYFGFLYFIGNNQMTVYGYKTVKKLTNMHIFFIREFANIRSDKK